MVVIECATLAAIREPRAVVLAGVCNRRRNAIYAVVVSAEIIRISSIAAVGGCVKSELLQMIDSLGAADRVGDLAGGGDEATRKFSLPSFGASIQLIASHRGLAAEQELIEFLGLARLMQIYDGADPSFPEAVEIARILSVPITSFVPVDPGSIRELDIAYAELLYAAAPLSAGQRSALASHLTDLAGELLTGGLKAVTAEPVLQPAPLNGGGGHE
ncbi:hypothetical protein [Glycocaulis sp.]|uniref:hypothetical protein n=1 Tax=Glycocaulis sp. TaxID=1969725 RepID=UPI003F6FC4F9